MQLRDKLHLVIYRVRERGLEIFVQDGALPEASDAAKQLASAERELIELEQVEGADVASRGVAVEGDYHDIPSLKGLLLDDARKLRDKLRSEEGSFVALKSIAQRVLPEQYRMLQELRDILVDRNSTKYM